MHLTIDQEFQSIIPPLAADEKQQLEQSLLTEGCRDALISWNGILIDGHNRYEICTTHNIAYQVVEREFSDRDAVREWIMRNQFARRNLTDHQRGVLALELKSIITARAKEAQGKRTDLLSNLTKSDFDCSSPGREAKSTARIANTAPINTRKEVAKLAGISEGTLRKVEIIEREAPEVVKEAARGDVISIDRAYNITKKVQIVPEDEREKAAWEAINEKTREYNREVDRRHRLKRTIADAVDGISVLRVDDEMFDCWIEDMNEEDIQTQCLFIEIAHKNLNDLGDRIKQHRTLRVVRRHS